MNRLTALASRAVDEGKHDLAVTYLAQAYRLDTTAEDINIKYFRALQAIKDKFTAVKLAESYFSRGLTSPRLTQMYILTDYNTYTISSSMNEIKYKMEYLSKFSAFQGRAAAVYLWHNDLDRARYHARMAIHKEKDTKIAEAIRRSLAKRAYYLGHIELADWICRIGRVGRSAEQEILYDRLIIRTGNAANTPTTHRLFQKLLAIQDYNRRLSLIDEFVDFKWRFEGPSHALVTLIDEHIEAYPLENNNEILQVKISLLVQLGSTNDALEILEATPALKSKFRNCLAVAKLIKEHGLDVPASAQKDLNSYYELYEELARSEENLRARFSDETRSVAVVGNSACEIGRGQGKRIDSYADVVRFNRFNTDPPYNIDYGSKVTAIVRQSGGRADFELQNQNSPSLIIVSSASILYRGRIWRAAKRLRDEGHTLCVFPQPFHTKLSRVLGGSPSSGISFIYLLKQLRVNIRRDDFFGFSFTDQIGLNHSSAHYFEHAKPSVGHMWEKERDLFDSFFGNGTELNEIPVEIPD
ncbi:glycosyltransferase family 29 protein [Methylobacterium marchantiae]|uniref:Glycosyltransferase family 29 protein n=1 Tax=Methylobacterium marchantiae TaxID=600331 RepID=A0ABW3X3D4_9HYPH